MHRVRPVSTEEVDDLADWLGLDFAAGEAADAADRIGTLADVYAGLEDAPVEAMADPGEAGDLFADRPTRPGPDEDRLNAWLSRFSLSRPEADGPLSGLSVGVKDNVAVRGAPMTVGSRAFEGFVPGGHARVVERLLDAGATVAGKTNMDELAFAPTGDTSAFGPTFNPRDTDHVPGGSSCGSAAAVADGQVDLALGTDTGGSVRIPASYCGIVGVKATFGRVPAHGVVDLAYSMDHTGVLARDVETAARGLEVIADAPPGANAAEGRNAGGADGPGWADDLGADLDDLTVGVAERYFAQHVSKEVERAVRYAIQDLEGRGATVREVEIPALDYSREAWWGIAPPEFAGTFATDGAGLWRHDRVEPSLAAETASVHAAGGRAFGRNVKEMLALGAHLLRDQRGYHYVRGQNLRAELAAQFDAVLEEVDVLAAPTTPTTALKVGEFERGVTPPVNWDTHPTNLTGHPSISVPAKDAPEMPVGLQFVGAWHDEATLFDVAETYLAG